MDDKTGSAFYVMEEGTTKYEWMAQLRPSSSKQRFLLYGSLVFEQERPSNTLRAKKPYQESATKRVHHPLAEKLDNGETGRSVYIVLPEVKTTPTPWQRPEIMFVTGYGPFPTYLKRFLWLRKLRKPLTLFYKLPVYNLIPPN
ncbi:hypothetical protein AVEN_217170-1 [Araneus ventricosus]|uniref:Uncharacterized protein n=1 Tax=Araneus ventricosus TaxID=182803 RepID=A0A4Y2SBB9_ARAVE|nr:hypothetical protein AVEN_121526-1 [Araneus ventricosus]GBN85528.1 hypothetical protein AVEN_217170-1 [Araneus ventricosus]